MPGTTLPVFLNPVLLEHSYARHLHTVSGWYSYQGKVGSCNRDLMVYKPRLFTIWPFKERFADSGLNQTL